MLDIETSLAEISALEEACKGTENAQHSTRNLMQERLQLLRTRILAGESTGDHIKDFVIARYYTFGEAIEERYRSLEQSLQDHMGQFILVIVRKEQPLTHTFGRGGSNYELFEELFLGVLAGEQLEITPEDSRWYCFLPTSHCAWLRDRTPSHYGKTLDISDYGSFHDQTHYKHLSGIIHETPLPAYEILVGDQAVKDWFAKRGEDNVLDRNGTRTTLLFGQMAKLVGRPLDPEEFPIVLEEELKERQAAKLAVIVAFGMLLAKQGHAGRFNDRFSNLGTGELEEHLRKTLKRATDLGLEQEIFPTLQELSKQYQS